MQQTRTDIALDAARTLSGITLRMGQTAEGLKVDRAAGVIYGVSVITQGQTKPSGNGLEPFDIDGVTLRQVMDAINASPIGIKSRLTHPELDGVDDLTVRKGYVRNARIEGVTVKADMYFHTATDVDAIRIMDIAKKDPTSAGLSIKRSNAEITPKPGTVTGSVLRIDGLDAVDWVGDPAGNPAGMLSTYRTNQNQNHPITLKQESRAMKFNPAQVEYLIAQGMTPDSTPEAIATYAASLDETQKAALKGLETPAVNPGDGASLGGDDDDDDKKGAALEGDDEKKKAAALAAEEEAKKKKTDVAARAAKPNTTGVMLSQGQVADMVTKAAKDERTRCADIRQVALQTGQDEKFISHHIDVQSSIDVVRQVALNQMARSPQDMRFTDVQVGTDLNRDSLGIAVQDAIMLRASQGSHRFIQLNPEGGIALGADNRPQVRKAHGRAADFRGHTVAEMGRRYLCALGYKEADRMQKPKLAELLMNKTRLQSVLGDVFLAHNTGDFPNLLADSMGKVLRTAYALAPATWPLWCNKTTAPDFKDIKQIQLGASPDLDEITDGEDYTFGTVVESQETYALTTYGKGINFTRRMLINDDLGAFSRIPMQMGQSCARKVESIAIAVLTLNTAMADAIALFHASHTNLGTGTLSVVSLGLGRSTMRKQTALGSDDPLELTPRYLLVPEELYVTASQVTASLVDPALNNATPNPFGQNGENPLTPISSSRLSTNSTTQWYLAADPSQTDTVNVTFLEGQETPQLEEENEFDTGNRRMKVTQDAAAKVIDFRGLFRSSGA